MKRNFSPSEFQAQAKTPEVNPSNCIGFTDSQNAGDVVIHTHLPAAIGEYAIGN